MTSEDIKHQLNNNCKVMQGHPEKKGLLHFLCDQSKNYGIM